MSTPSTSVRDAALAKIRRLSRIGLFASTAAFILASGFLGYYFWCLAVGDAETVTTLIDELEIADYVTTLTTAQRWVAGLLWISVNLLGVLMLWYVRMLFAGFLERGVFTTYSARCLRRVGILILLLGPVSVLTVLIAGIVITAWTSGSSAHGAIAIMDSDVYALVIGLVITAVSHIMLDAARLADENDAFV